MKKSMIFRFDFFADASARYRNLLLAGTALAGAALFPSFAQAQFVWGGTTTTTDYNLGSNWSPQAGAPPFNAGQSAVFDTTGTAAANVTAGPIAPDSWTFTATSQSYTVTGQAVNFSGPGPNLINNASAGQAISISNNMTGTTLLQAAASTLTLSGTNSFTNTTVSGGTLVNTGALTSTVGITAGGTFSNSQSVTGVVNNSAGGFLNNNAFSTIGGLITNAGTAINSANGTLSGGVSNTAGTFSNSGTIYNGIAVSGGTVSNSSNTVYNGVTVSGTGTYTQTAGVTRDGLTNSNIVNAISGGFVGAIANNAGGTFNVNAAALDTVGSTNAFDNAAATSRLLVNSGTFTAYGMISNSGTDVAGGIRVTASAYLIGNGGGLTNNSGATIVNNGGVFGDLNNAGIVTNNATHTATNGGFNSDVVTNTGTITNTAAGTWAGNVISNASNATGITNSGIWVGDVQANTGTINNNLTWTGTITTSGTFNNNAPGTVSGLVANSGTGTNSGTLNGGLSNSAGTFGNTGAINSGVTVSGGTVNNSNVVAGGVTVSGTGTYAQTTGTTSGGLTNTNGTVNANGGAINGAIVNGAGGSFIVHGTTTSDSTFNNSSGSSFLSISASVYTVTGPVTNSGGTLLGGGDILISATGTLIANGGITNNINANFISGGTVVGAFTNLGTVDARGTFNGAVSNNGAGVFHLSGSLTNNSSFTNNGTATLLVTGGDYTGLTTVTNNSTNAAGISVAAGRTLGATSLVNAAGATINNLGTITTTSTVNNGTITGAYAMAAGNLSGVGNTQSLSVNSGTFAPGNGTAGSSMTVTGSLVMQAAATYLVQVNPTTASFTSVTGAATFNGATVSANFAAGSYVSKRYTILTAVGVVNDTFGTLVTTGQPANMNSTLSYDTHNAYLNLNLNFAIPGGTLSQNQQNVGNALTGFFNSTGGIPMAFASLTAAQLTQSDGEVGTGSQQSTFNAMNQFMGVMTDPFVAGRGDPVSTGGGATGYADEQAIAYAAKRNPNDALGAIYRKAPMADAFVQRWSVWAAGYGGSQTTSGNAALGSSNSSSNLYGTAVGADYRLSPDTLAGFALAGGGTNFSVANGLGSGRSDLFQAGAFVRHNIGAAYFSGALAYGWQDITTNRTLTIAGIDQLQAKFNANAWSGRVEGGYRFVTQGLGWTPYAAGQFTTFDLPAYTEQAIVGANTFALAYGAKSVTATRSELGLRTDKSFAMADGVFTLRGRAAWAHDYNPDQAIGATFQMLPGASFVVNGARQASDAALVTASAEKKWLNGWSAAGTFEGEFSGVTNSYAGKGVVRYAW